MQIEVTIKNEEGLHARPAASFVKTANEFESDINIIANGNEVNAKSIMSLMGLGLTKDSVITITANGSDEQNAIDRLSTLVNNKFEL